LVDIDLDDTADPAVAIDDRQISLDIKRRPVLFTGPVIE
jgi:hypothetical protein